MRIEVNEPNDPQIKVFQDLRDHVLRQKRERPGGDMAGIFIAEGDIVVERALNAGYELESLLIDAKRTKPMPALINDSVPQFAASDEVLQQITGYNIHRGCIACFRRKDLLTVDTVLAQMADDATLLIHENINNPTNMGVILRCAAALGVGGLLMDQTCSDPLYRRSVRVSMGEAFSMPYARFDDWPSGLSQVEEAGYEVWALTPADDAEDISQIRTDKKIALMLGAEAPGLTDQALAAATRKVKIPMTGTVDSLNVGVAAAIAFYAVQQNR